MASFSSPRGILTPGIFPEAVSEEKGGYAGSLDINLWYHSLISMKGYRR